MDRLYALSEGIGSLPIYLRLPLMSGLLFVGFVGLFITWLLSRAVWRILAVHVFNTDVYSSLPRPKHEYWTFPLYGDLGSIQKSKPAEAHIKWTRELDNVYVYRGILYGPRLLLADTRAMNYILGQAQSYEYPKPDGSRKFLEELLGNGLLVAEGERERHLLSTSSTSYPFCELETHTLLHLLSR